MSSKVTCDKCGAGYKIDEAKIPATGGAVRCQQCGARFAVIKTAEGLITKGLEQAAAPSKPPAPSPTSVSSTSASEGDAIALAPAPAAAPAAPRPATASAPRPAVAPAPGPAGTPFARPATAPSARPATEPSPTPLPSVPLPSVPLPSAPVAPAFKPGAFSIPPNPSATPAQGLPAIALPQAPAAPVASSSPRPAPTPAAGFSLPPISLPKAAAPATSSLGGIDAARPIDAGRPATQPTIPLPPPVEDDHGEAPIPLAGGPADEGDESSNLAASFEDPDLAAPEPDHAPIAMGAADFAAPPAADDEPIALAPPAPADESDVVFNDEETSEAAAPPSPAEAAPAPIAESLPAYAANPVEASVSYGDDDGVVPLGIDDADIFEEEKTAITSAPTMDLDDLPQPDLPTPTLDKNSLREPDDLPGVLPSEVAAAAPMLPHLDDAPDLDDVPDLNDAPDLDDIPAPTDMPEPLEVAASKNSPADDIADSGDELPTPLEFSEDELSVSAPAKKPAVSSAARASAAFDEPPLFGDEEPAPKSRVPLIIGGAAAAVVVLGLGAAYFAGLMPVGKKPPPPPAVALPSVPPLPDVAALDDADMPALRGALEVLQARAKAKSARGEPADGPEERALKLRILWHGAVFNGARDFASELTNQASSAPAAEGSPHPDQERAALAMQYLRGDKAAVLASAQKLLARDKGDAQTLLIDALQKQRDDDAKGAAADYDAVLVVSPKNLHALLGLATLAKAAGDKEAAESWLKQAVTAHPASARVKLLQAEFAYDDPAQREKAASMLSELGATPGLLGSADQARLDVLMADMSARKAYVLDAEQRLASALKNGASAKAGRRLAWLMLYEGKLPEAAKTFDEVEKLDATKAGAESIFLGRVELALRKKDLEEAKRLVVAAAKGGMNKARVFYADGLIAEAMPKPLVAIKTYGAVSKLDKAFTPAVARALNLAMAKAKPKVKIAKLTALVHNARDASLLVLLADALVEDGELKQAADVYKEAIAADPWEIDLPAAAARLIEVLVKAGRAGEAVAIVEKSQAVDPKNPAAVLRVVDFAAQSGAFDEAEKWLEKGLAEQPQSFDLRLARAKVLTKKKQLDKARALLQEVLKNNEQKPEAHEAMALTYFPDEPDLVKLHIKRAIDLAPKTPRYHMLLAQAYMAKNKNDEAADALQRVIELEPKNLEATIMLAKALGASERRKDAMAMIKKALALDPKRGDLYVALGQLFEDDGDAAGALQQYQNGLRYEPDNPGLLAHAANVFQQKGNRQAAILLYQKATKQKADDPSFYYHLGFLYKDNGQARDAVRAFEEYLKLSPKAEDAKEIEAEIGDLRK